MRGVRAKQIRKIVFLDDCRGHEAVRIARELRKAYLELQRRGHDKMAFIRKMTGVRP